MKYFLSLKNFLKKTSWIFIIIAFYALLQLFGITCPIKYLFGVSCMGCGMTRAWISVFHFNFSKAFYYHPLFWLPPLVLIIYFFKNKINKKIYIFFIFTSLLLFVIIYIYRISSGTSEIVTFQIENGLLFRLVKKLT